MNANNSTVIIPHFATNFQDKNNNKKIAAIVTGIPTSYNTTVLTWTNTSGGWTISGIELWDQAGTPNRWMWGTWIGAPISVASGNSFQVPASGLIATLQ